jgi:zinc transport system ATP-binding protein
MSEIPAIRLEHVFFAYDGPLVLEDITLEIRPREFMGLVGPNGGGKTTLLRVILGLETPSAGVVRVFGQEPRLVRHRIGYVPQVVNLTRDFPLLVEEAVLMGRLGCTRRVGGYRSKDRELAVEAMQRTGIFELRHRPVGALSGGQMQRVLIARALISEPYLLILDEPTSNVDTRGEQDTFELLKVLNREKTILLVSHDLGFISSFVNRVACLNRRLVCHQASAITGENIEELYGRPLRIIHHNT